MTKDKATATWTQRLPTADGDYYSRIDEYDKSPTPIRIDAGKLFEFGCEKDLSAEYQTEAYEYLGPITPDLFAEVARLREALGDILQCFENGATPHISIVERARTVLGRK